MTNIAILLAAYNGELWLPEQLNSILNQKDVTTHVIISIDTSDDQTSVICDYYANFYDKVSVLPKSISFGSAAANFFRLICDVDFNQFDYVAFADQDDIWNDDKLLRAVSELKRTQSDAYSSNVTAFWQNGKIQLINKAQSQVQWDYLFESAGPGCTFVLTKILALHIQAFVQQHPTEINSVWLHDWFMYAFTRSHGYHWTIDTQSTMQYRQHANNQVGVNHGLNALKHRAKFIFSGQWFKQVALVTTLVGKHDSDFVESWLSFSRFGFLKLAFQARKCRRKRREQVWFFCICLLMSLLGLNKEQK
jgi:rhamnosyltransferase